jgi:zinc and cadmium transporter
MDTVYLFPLLSVLVVSLISLVGVLTLSLSDRALKASVFALVSLAVGALLGDAFLHLIPEAFESELGDMVPFAIIGGILIFFILEKVLHWHHHQGMEDMEVVHPVGKMILLSDGLHNFIDGLIIGASYFVSVEIGIATTVAVILHEIPQEIGDFGILIHAGYSKTRALWLNFASAVFAVLGAGTAFLLGASSEVFSLWLLPIAAGGFIYIAMADLIPELHKSKAVSHSLVQFSAIVLGIASMAALLVIEPAHGHEDISGEHGELETDHAI